MNKQKPCILIVGDTPTGNSLYRAFLEKPHIAHVAMLTWHDITQETGTYDDILIHISSFSHIFLCANFQMFPIILVEFSQMTFPEETLLISFMPGISREFLQEGLFVNKKQIICACMNTCIESGHGIIAHNADTEIQMESLFNRVCVQKGLYKTEDDLSTLWVGIGCMEMIDMLFLTHLKQTDFPDIPMKEYGEEVSKSLKTKAYLTARAHTLTCLRIHIPADGFESTLKHFKEVLAFPDTEGTGMQFDMSIIHVIKKTFISLDVFLSEEPFTQAVSEMNTHIKRIEKHVAKEFL